MPLNEECIFENVPLKVVKMKSGSKKVVNMQFPLIFSFSIGKGVYFFHLPLSKCKGDLQVANNYAANALRLEYFFFLLIKC